MSLTLLAPLIGIALVDSFNPTIIAIQVLLLAAARPVARTLAYLAGVFTLNTAAGFLIVAGLGAVIQDLFANPGPVDYLIQLVLGVVLVAIGLIFRFQSDEQETRRLPGWLTGPVGAFMLGGIAILGELPTALPYLAGIEQITRARLDTAGNLLALGLYNFIYCLPLVGILALFLAVRQRVAPIFARINAWMKRLGPPITRIFLVGLGALLVLDALVFFAGGGAPL
ncbi:MAG: GAP family protein [Anaerolineae bacterium]|nr:GAP family protein [Anaerolineae bacterium]